MDWLTQNRFRNWLIGVLLAGNLLTISIIWTMTANRSAPQTGDQGHSSSESVRLLKKALDLSVAQEQQVDSTLAAGRVQSGRYNDRLSELKRQLAEELFSGNPDTSVANITSREIGELQSNVEMIRFRYFRRLVAICTPVQRDKLKPIVIEVFGRKPPRDESGGNEPWRDGRQEQKPPEAGRDTTPGDKPRSPHEGEPAPPSVDQKLADYSDKLNLNDKQKQELRAVLLQANRNGEDLRTGVPPEQGGIQAEKERIRKEEDEAIMKILNNDQKKKFERLTANRRK